MQGGRTVTLRRQMSPNDMDSDAKLFSALEGLALQDLISLQLRSNLKLQISYLATPELFIISPYKTTIWSRFPWTKTHRIKKKKNSQREATKGVERKPASELDSPGLWLCRCDAGLFMNFSEPVFSSINYHYLPELWKLRELLGKMPGMALLLNKFWFPILCLCYSEIFSQESSFLKSTAPAYSPSILLFFFKCNMFIGV